MKTLYSEQYYRSNWGEFLKRVPGEYYINLEQELSNRMDTYIGVQLSGEDLNKIRNIEAKKIADSCEAKCRKQMQVLKDIMSGKVSFGYTHRAQEVRARSEFQKRFEFNCLQLADFRKKYK